MGGKRSSQWMWAAAVGTLALGTACFDAPPEAKARLAEVHADAKETNAALDTLEDRLVADQANQHLWEELGRRHQHVSAIAIKNQSDHYAEMVRLLDMQQEKARKLKRSRVASADTVLSRATASASRVHSKHD